MLQKNVLCESYALSEPMPFSPHSCEPSKHPQERLIHLCYTVFAHLISNFQDTMQHDCHSSSFYLKSFDDNQHFLIFALNISVLGYEMSPCKVELKVEESGVRI